MIRTPILAGVFTALFSAPCGAAAQTDAQAVRVSDATGPAQPAAGIVNLDPLTVSGPQPGPGLWRVSRGEHDLWILGALSPLPEGITWNADSVVDLVGQSQEVLWGPRFVVDADVGFFRKLSLGYGMLKAEKNPDGATLEDVLSPELYARWAAAKQRYLPRDRGIERKRPMVAAREVFLAAIGEADLGFPKIISPPIRAVTQADGIKETTPKVSVKIEDPAGAIKDVRRMSLNDSACLEATLDAIDRLLPRMITNANAWATGDLAQIRFDQLDRRNNTCADVFSNAEFSRKWGIPDIRASTRDEWLRAAEASLAKNTTTFAVLPLEDLVAPDGYVARLRALGYEIDAP
ncbi:TraB/GumN family protein [Lysobacter ciconiae]|uniref:TraB/GumN family protein n=1 Tax=Novilysobacter ciconiae TaxID=2781022 RepID=A0A7S6UFC2_9GAMM|nr:TraB/GumN family protein [Lysobacter ciconiae]QOW19256.1 TraB/GumN family protein [Lysobacter ciconiae]